MNSTSRAYSTVFAWALACTGLLGCQSAPPAHSETTPTGQTVGIRLDGSIDDWPPDAACVGDADYIYVRMSVQDQQFTLQHAPRTLAVFLDLDGSLATGLGDDAPSPDARGADMIIEFSPRTGGPTPGQGVAVYAVDRDGTRRVVRHADVDLSFAPTYAAPWYELRVSRRPNAASPLARLLSQADHVRGVIVLFDEGGTFNLSSDAFEASLPPAAAEGPRAQEIPPKAAGNVRVVSWNIRKSAPEEHPDAFARLLKALDPDIVLLQEWDKGDVNAVQGWFTAFVPSGSGWQTAKSADGDVAIASRYPIVPPAPGTPKTPGDDKPVRFVSATASTPAGEILVATMHLKCCGAKDTAEDARRLAEARSINAWLRSSKTLPAMRVVGGDLNLVGTRPPLDVLRAGLDPNGSDLSVTEPYVLGDSSLYTWTDDTNEFTPGRLDYVLWSASSAAVTHQFVLDTARLSDSTLAHYHLRADDSRASDHLPVVVDIEPGGPRAGPVEGGVIAEPGK